PLRPRAWRAPRRSRAWRGRTARAREERRRATSARASRTCWTYDRVIAPNRPTLRTRARSRAPRRATCRGARTCARACAARGRQRQDGMFTRIERVDGVVRRARMVGPALQNAERDRSSLHLAFGVRAVVSIYRQQRQRVLKRDLVVVGKIEMHLCSPAQPASI